MHCLGLTLIFVVVFNYLDAAECQFGDGNIDIKKTGLKNICKCSQTDQACSCCLKYNKSPFDANACVNFHLRDVLIKGSFQTCIDFYTGHACGILLVNVTESQVCYKETIQFGQLMVYTEGSCYQFATPQLQPPGAKPNSLLPHFPTGKIPRPKNAKRKNAKRKSAKRKSAKRKNAKRKNAKRKNAKRTNAKRTNAKRKNSKRMETKSTAS